MKNSSFPFQSCPVFSKRRPERQISGLDESPGTIIDVKKHFFTFFIHGTFFGVFNVFFIFPTFLLLITFIENTI